MATATSEYHGAIRYTNIFVKSYIFLCSCRHNNFKIHSYIPKKISYFGFGINAATPTLQASHTGLNSIVNSCKTPFSYLFKDNNKLMKHFKHSSLYLTYFANEMLKWIM